MPFAVRGKIEGLDRIIAKLRAVKEKVAKKALKKGITNASKIVARKAKRLAPEGETKQLKKSIGRKVKVFRNTGIVSAIIGPRVGFKIVVRVRTRGKNAGKPVYANPTQYAHLVELGTGHAAAKPFLRPALAASADAVRAAIADAVNEAIRSA